MHTVIYNCKRCKTGKRVDYPNSRKGFGGRTEYWRADVNGKSVSPGIWVDSASYTGNAYTFTYGGDPLGLCSGCGKKMTYGVLKSVVALDHKCDARCTHARGPNCECSCGGENHGIAA